MVKIDQVLVGVSVLACFLNQIKFVQVACVGAHDLRLCVAQVWRRGGATCLLLWVAYDMGIE